jgi:hypothetical protein
MTVKSSIVHGIFNKEDEKIYNKSWHNFVFNTYFEIKSVEKIKPSVIRVDTAQGIVIVKLHPNREVPSAEWWKAFHPSLNRMVIEANGLRWLEHQNQTDVQFPRLLATDENTFLVAEWVSGRPVRPDQFGDMAALGHALAAFHMMRPEHRPLRTRLRHSAWAFRRFLEVIRGAWMGGASGLSAFAHLSILIIFRRRRQFHVQHNDFHLGQAVLKKNGKIAIFDFGQPLVSRFQLVDVIKTALTLGPRSQPFLNAYLSAQQYPKWCINEIRMCALYYLLTSIGKIRTHSETEMKKIQDFEQKLSIFNCRNRTRAWSSRALSVRY